jgi:RNA polymerase sigma factor (TIGR02999 family)
LLRAWGGGDPAALDRLTPLVYEQLRRMARRYMRNERLGHTLQATALVNEAFRRLVDSQSLDWTDRGHFFAVCARVMRRILVDAARSRAAIKRRGQADRAEHSAAINLDRLPNPASEMSAQVCALGDALNTLAQIDPRRAHVIELRFFWGTDGRRDRPSSADFASDRDAGVEARARALTVIQIETTRDIHVTLTRPQRGDSVS